MPQIKVNSQVVLSNIERIQKNVLRSEETRLKEQLYHSANMLVDKFHKEKISLSKQFHTWICGLSQKIENAEFDCNQAVEYLKKIEIDEHFSLKYGTFCEYTDSTLNDNQKYVLRSLHRKCKENWTKTTEYYYKKYTDDIKYNIKCRLNELSALQHACLCNPSSVEVLIDVHHTYFLFFDSAE